VPPDPGEKIDEAGAWCPHCGNRRSSRSTQGVGCLVIAAICTLGLALLAWPFLPKTWFCSICKHEWKA
jgi:hypothetical protein